MTTDEPTPPHGFPAAGWPALDQRTNGNGRRHAKVERQPRDDTTRYLCAALLIAGDIKLRIAGLM